MWRWSFFFAFTAVNGTTTLLNTSNGPRKLWLVFAVLRRGWNSSLMMLQRTGMGESLTNDPDYVPNIHRPRTRALPERQSRSIPWDFSIKDAFV
jgi:hypothetical protein